MKLRPYQSDAIDALYTYFEHHDGHPIVATPTGSGKSVILAGFIHRALAGDPLAGVTVITHRKELIEQDASAILRYWPEAPLGIYSSGLKSRDIQQITVAGIQSIHGSPGAFAHTDLIIIDECHLLSKTAGTMYRRFIACVQQYQPKVKVVGLTATPYRMDSGLLHKGKDRIFTDIAYEANVVDLIRDGYLSPLISRAGKTRADLSGLHTRAGDFIPAELSERMDKADLVNAACLEMMAYGQDRKSWLVFCSGVVHAGHVAACLQYYGIDAHMVCGATPSADRARLLADFKAGKIRCLTNADLLTVGFDHPGIDLIGFLRPTQSVGLYVQMAGRGLRIADGKENCLVLDFAGNVMRHGPIDHVCITQQDAKEKGGNVVAPAKECPECAVLVHCAVMICPVCDYAWPAPDKHDRTADDAPIIGGKGPQRHAVTSVLYHRHEPAGRAPSLRVDYWCGFKTFSTWLGIESEKDYPAKLANRWFQRRGFMMPHTVDDALYLLAENDLPEPTSIEVERNGKYWNVTKEYFN